ncbi:ankyrin repeat-containing domain protein [Baffinella frigidus]|nr:ankyrin repeat-containing domain protein [Cryptophyta sp. CCMP2293]
MARGERSSLSRAAEIGETNVVLWLIAEGDDVSAKDGNAGATPLHWAAQGGQAETLQVLLRAGADVAAQAYDGATPLHWAARFGQEGVAILLLDAGANVSAKTSEETEGKTALDLAEERGHAGAARVLREAGTAQSAPAPDGVAEVPVGAQSAQAVAQVLGQADAEGTSMAETLCRAAGGGETQEVLRVVRRHVRAVADGAPSPPPAAREDTLAAEGANVVVRRLIAELNDGNGNAVLSMTKDELLGMIEQAPPAHATQILGERLCTLILLVKP